MSKDYFNFKQFTIHQERCAMKVGTDGALIGAYASVENASRILDIGTGTGLIALMVAQRSKAQITGIELDQEATLQAKENVMACPWKERIEIIQGDFRNYPFEGTFDCILSNPPFLGENLRCPDLKRNIARHSDSLSYEDLLKGVSRLLTEKGNFTCIITTSSSSDFIQSAYFAGLFPRVQVNIYTRPSRPSKRTIFVLSRFNGSCQQESLIIEESPQQYSKAFTQLLHNYYLYL